MLDFSMLCMIVDLFLQSYQTKAIQIWINLQLNSFMQSGVKLNSPFINRQNINIPARVISSNRLFFLLRGEFLYFLQILLFVCLVQCQGLLLCRALDVRFVFQQLLHPEENLLDCNVWFPILLFVQNRQADCSRRVNVRVREHWLEYTFRRPSLNVNYLTGKSCEKSIVRVYVASYHGESLGPGIQQCHFNIFKLPSVFSVGLATNPKGWSLLHYFLYFLSLLMTSQLTSFLSICRNIQIIIINDPCTCHLNGRPELIRKQSLSFHFKYEFQIQVFEVYSLNIINKNFTLHTQHSIQQIDQYNLHKLKTVTQLKQKQIGQILSFSKSKLISLTQKQKYFTKIQLNQDSRNKEKIQMVRKNQLKRLSLEKLHEFAKANQDGQTLTMVNQVVTERNDVLEGNTNQLRVAIEKVRKQTKKTIKQLNEAVHDRLLKKQKIVLDKASRPTSDDIRQLIELFTFFQHQTSLIDRNNKTLDKTLAQKYQNTQQITSTFLNPEQKFTQLDHQYERLNVQCQKESVKVDSKRRQQEQFNSHLENINKTIEEYRLNYEEVEGLIRNRQKELDHFVTYFTNRNQQDEENLQRQRKLTQMLEHELLENQKKYNQNYARKNDLEIMDIQTHSIHR